MAAPMSKAVVKASLKAVPLFADLTEQEIEMVAASSRSVPAK